MKAVVKTTKKLISAMLTIAMILTSCVWSGTPVTVKAETTDDNTTISTPSGTTDGSITAASSGAITATSSGAIAATGGAITYYVAVNGNDETGDGSEAKPYATIAKGVSLLQPGDTLTIESGNYSEQEFSLVNLKGTKDAPINIIGAGKVKFSKTMQNSYTGKFCAGVIQSCEYVNVLNINFDYSNSEWVEEADTLITCNNKKLTVKNCLFTVSSKYAPYTQIRVQGCEDSTYDSNTIKEGGDSAFYLWGNISKVNFTNNIITTYYGFNFQGVDNCKIVNNILDTGGPAFYGGTYTNCIVANNIITGPNWSTFDSSNTCEYNAYTDVLNEIDVSKKKTDIIASASDMFIGNGDYHLKADSPCIGTGSSDTYVPQTDFAGGVRRIPSDIGAYNFGNSYYVSTNGNDANNGLSSTSAFATFEAAIKAAKADPGSSILIEGGNYTQSLNLDGIGSLDSLTLMIKSYNGEVQLSGESALIIKNSYNLNISGIHVDGAASGSAVVSEEAVSGSAIILSGANNCKLHSLSVTNSEVGLSLEGGSTKCEIYNSDFADSNGNDITLGNSNKNKIYNNIFTGKYGIDNNGACTNTVITNNVFKNTSEGYAVGPFTQDSSCNIIQNNIIASNMNYSGMNTYNFNLYDSSVFTKVPEGDGAYSIIGNPDFTDSNYHIGINSSCRNQGNDKNAPELDRDSKIRDGLPDIGAYEYTTRSETFNITKKTPDGSNISISKDKTKVQITFSETLNSSLKIEDYISVTKTKDNSPVAGSYKVENLAAGGTIVTFTAEKDYAYSTSYTVTVKNTITNASNKLINYASDFSWDFTTEVLIMNTYYIAVDGDDSNPGTIDSPKKTLNNFKSALKPGDTVIWREGTYDEYVALTKAMPAGGEPITFKAYEGEKVILTASSGGTVYATIYGVAENQNLRFEGLTFEPTADQDYKGNALRFYNYGGSKIYVSNCTFKHCSPSISVIDELDKKYEAIEICNNTIISDGAESGLYFQEARVADGSWGKIYNNVIYNAKWSIKLWGRSKNILFYNNTFADTYDKTNASGWYDIYPVAGSYNKETSPVDISENLIFKNNIFTKPIRTQLEVNKSILDLSQKCIFDNNVYDSDSLVNYVTYNYGGDGKTLTFSELQSYQDRSLEKNGVYGNVTFVNPKSDARIIQADNAAIGVATTDIVTGVSAPTTDINGNSRSKNEAGAFAYNEKLAFVGNYNGTDSNGSFVKPYHSIKEAQEHGATQIEVIKGNYTEDQTITGDISIKPYSDNVVFSGKVSLIGTDSGKVSVNGVTFNGEVDVSGLNVSVNNSTFNDSLIMNQANGASIISNTFKSALNNAITLNDCVDCSLMNDVITERKAAMILNGSSVNNKIYNNTFYKNESDISLGSEAKDNIFKNNIISTAIKNRDNNIFDYNLYNSDTIAAEDLKAIQETNSVIASPNFINAKAKDFRIYRLSPCVGAGIKDENSPSKDITEVSRNNPPDIGAYAVRKVKYYYYVDGTNGNDENAGTENAPFRTINAALKVIRADETIIVKNGTYKENIDISGKVAEEADSYVIKSDEAAILDGRISIDTSTGVTIDGLGILCSDADTAVTVSESPYTTLKNITVIKGTVGIQATHCSNLVIDQAVIENVKKGIIVDGNNDSISATIAQTKVNHASERALEALNKVNVTVNTSIISNSKEGIYGTGEASFFIVNNTFYNNSGYSINITQLSNDSTSLNVYNNIFSRAEKGKGAFSYISKRTGFLSDYNLYDAAENDVVTHFYGKDQTFAQTVANGDESNGILGDPMFKDAVNGNLHLLKGSAATRTGLKVISVKQSFYAPDIDMDGTPYSKKTMDMGAYYTPYSCKELHVASGYTGKKSNGSADAPYKTLAQAYAAVDSGDTIIVHKGIYYGRIDASDLHGVADAPITIKAAEDDSNYSYSQSFASLAGPIITSKNDYTDPDETAKEDVGIKLVNCSYVTMEGLNYTGYTGAAIWTVDCDHMVIQNMNIWDIDDPKEHTSGVEAILAGGTTNSLFKNLNIWDIAQTLQSQADHGIYIGGCSNCTFDSVKVEKAPGAGLQVYSGDNYNINSTNCTIQNCVFAECKYGLILVGVDGFTITNNTFYNNWENDLYLDWIVKNNRFQNNIFYNDRTEPVKDGDTNVKPVIVGYQWNCIKKENGTVTKMITGNSFANNFYQYKTFPANCAFLADSGKVLSIDKFMESENAAETNNKYTNMYTGKVNFVGSFSKTDSIYEKAMKLVDNILQLKSDSECINKGVAALAPSVDIQGNLRDSLPDIGAYESTGSSITLSQDEITMDFGTTQKITAQINPFSSERITYKSSNTDVVTVDKWGTITAVGIGTTAIIASAGNMIAQCTVTVTADSSTKSITMLKTKYKVGEDIQVFYMGAADKDNWDWVGVYNDGADVKKYNSYEYVKGTGCVNMGSISKAGNYDIVLLLDNDYIEQDRISISVVEPVPVNSVSISKDKLTLTKGELSQLSASVNEETTEDKNIVWSTSNASVVDVDMYGRIYATGSGTAVITAASYADSTKIATCTVTVKEAEKPTPTPTEIPPTPTPTDVPPAPTTVPTEPTATVTPTPTAVPTPVVTTKKNKDGSTTKTIAFDIVDSNGNKATINAKLVTDKDGKITSATAAISVTPVVTTSGNTVTCNMVMPTEQLLKFAKEYAGGTTLQVTCQFSKESALSLLKNVSSSYNVVITQPSALTKGGKVKVSNIVLTKEVLQVLKVQGSKLTVTVKNEKDRASYTWTFDGAAFKDSKIKFTDVNVAVNFIASKEDKAAKSIIKKDSKNSSGVVLDLSSKNLPAKTTLKVNVKAQGITDKQVYVYAIDRKNNKLIAQVQVLYKVDADGCITLNAASGQDYLILTHKPDRNVIK